MVFCKRSKFLPLQQNWIAQKQQSSQMLPLGKQFPLEGMVHCEEQITTSETTMGKRLRWVSLYLVKPNETSVLIVTEEKGPLGWNGELEPTHLCLASLVVPWIIFWRLQSSLLMRMDKMYPLKNGKHFLRLQCLCPAHSKGTWIWSDVRKCEKAQCGQCHLVICQVHGISW